MDDMKDNKDKIERPFSFLSDLVGKRVNVRVLFCTAGGVSRYTGILQSFDQHVNITLTDAVESLHSATVSSPPMTVFIRGSMIISIFEGVK